MPKQNRVMPAGQLIATAARGTLLGNRGVLHDEHGQIRRLYQSKRWIYCQLSFKGRWRQVMTPNRYTELFFLDEATALAAGHRPCAECLRPCFNEFQRLWAEANPEVAGRAKPPVNVIDGVLHKERVQFSRHPEKVTYTAPLAALPSGTFIAFDLTDPAYLVLPDRLLSWTVAGYREPMARPAETRVQVLTPRSIVRTLAQGYVPTLHPSAMP
jgi:hypothetical protein